MHPRKEMLFRLCSPRGGRPGGRGTGRRPQLAVATWPQQSHFPSGRQLPCGKNNTVGIKGPRSRKRVKQVGEMPPYGSFHCGFAASAGPQRPDFIHGKTFKEPGDGGSAFFFCREIDCIPLGPSPRAYSDSAPVVNLMLCRYH